MGWGYGVGRLGVQVYQEFIHFLTGKWGSGSL